MVSALRQIVTVQAGGVVRIQSDELHEGSQAEVLVISESSADDSTVITSPAWKQFIGIGANPGRSVEEIDRSLRELS